MEETKVRVLPADVYDALELSALEFGGIGASSRHQGGCPWCVIGHAGFLDGLDPLACNMEHYAAKTPALSALRKAFNTTGMGVALKNDGVIKEDGRISFDEWCKRLNVVRGDQ